MRNEEDKLRTCPTCGTKVDAAKHLGLRDYTWINEKLPGKVGLMDIDGVLERKGHVLMLETKPLRESLKLGQRITYRSFVKMGVHVWVVWHENDTVKVGRMDERGEVPFTTDTNVAGLVRHIEDWYWAADNGEL